MKIFEITSNLPNTNSNGKPIANDQTHLQNFWNWFNGSKVIDQHGRPIVVYHGTGQDISSFKQKDLNIKPSGHFLDIGIHFATNSETPSEYATYSRYPEHPTTKGMSSGMQGGNPTVYPVYLKIKNMIDISNIPTELKSTIIDIAIQAGVSERSKFIKLFDNDPLPLLSIIQKKLGRKYLQHFFISNGYDGIKYEWQGENYVVFSGSQIISAIGNTGKFSNNDNIIDEVAKASISHDPNDFGTYITDKGKPEKTTRLPINKLVGLEPDSKMDDPASRKNLNQIIRALQTGATLPPLLVRKIAPLQYQILDGHHRFAAYKQLGFKEVPVRIIHKANVKDIK